MQNEKPPGTAFSASLPGVLNKLIGGYLYLRFSAAMDMYSCYIHYASSPSCRVVNH